MLMIFQLLMVRGKKLAHQNGHNAQFCLKSYKDSAFLEKCQLYGKKNHDIEKNY